MNDLYTFTVPVFIKTLDGLKKVLAKAEGYAKEKGIDEKTFLADQLIGDMFPLTKQVQSACDQAKNGTARLAAVEAPRFEDTEQTFSELQTRIDRTIDYLNAVPKDAFTDAATRQVVLPYFKDKYFTGFDYAREYLIPNFYFHTVIAYGIVRKNGVQIGKGDYINGLPLNDLPA